MAAASLLCCCRAACLALTLCGWAAVAASFVMDIDDVLLASTTSSLTPQHTHSIAQHGTTRVEQLQACRSLALAEPSMRCSAWLQCAVCTFECFEDGLFHIHILRHGLDNERDAI